MPGYCRWEFAAWRNLQRCKTPTRSRMLRKTIRRCEVDHPRGQFFLAARVAMPLFDHVPGSCSANDTGSLGHVNVAMTSTDGEGLHAVAPRGSTCRSH